MARANGWKGYVPSVGQPGNRVIVADESRNKELVRTGWVRVTNYDGDRREGYQGKRGVYQSTVGGMNKFKQGVIQTVNDTWQGVDALNGTSLSGETAGVYLGSRVQRISQQAYTNPGKNDGLKPDTYLQPIFNELNEVVSYERPISPALLKGLDKDTHLGRMLGVWVGRILEEEAADKANDSVVKVAKEIWDNLKGKQAGDFINVADPKNKDPVVRDAWKTFGWQVKQEAEAVFGAPDTFWVRKDMVRDLTGYRSPGIRDAWTGISRWKPEVRTWPGAQHPEQSLLSWSSVCRHYQGKRGVYQSKVGGQNPFRQAVPLEGICTALNST